MWEYIHSILGFYPSDEQKEIVKAYLNNKNILIEAYAGSAKSSSLYLCMLADRYENNKSRKVLMLTFSKHLQVANEKEIKKLSLQNEVKALTIHALAHRYVMSQYNVKLVKFIHHSKLKDYCNIQGQNSWRTSQDVEQLCNSSKPLDESVSSNLFTAIWKKKRVTHSMILKRFTLDLMDDPTILDEYDCIVGDELQDMNEAITSVIANSNTQVICVGDNHQKIFEFLLKGYSPYEDKLFIKRFNTKLYLTQSFRCGNHLLAPINYFMKHYLGADKEFKGIDNNPKSPIKTLAVLTRTNADLLAFADSLMKKNLKFRFQKPYTDLFKPLVEFEYVFNNFEELKLSSCKNGKDIRRVKGCEELSTALVSEILAYNFNKWKYGNFKRYIKEHGMGEYKTALTVLTSLKDGVSIKGIYNELPHYIKSNAQITLATAFTYKGEEADKVILFRFPSIHDLIQNLQKTLIKEGLLSKGYRRNWNHADFMVYLKTPLAKETIAELNLFYVALTRARYQIQYVQTNYQPYYDIDLV